MIVISQGVKPTLLTFALVAALCLYPASSFADWAYEYDKTGLQWTDPDSGSYLWLGLRAQLRYESNNNDLRFPADFDKPEDSGGTVSRSRYKIGAGFRDALTFYHEYDLRNDRLLDLRASWVANPAFTLRAGQWKAEYNRERVDSSGKQQFVERSIATYWFTIDRQWGAMASGRLWQGSPRDSIWWAGVLGGNGRSNSSDGGRPMIMGRWQWNYTGDVLPFSQSALKRYAEPRASLSFGLVANDSRYTRFSSSGGGQLPGYEEGEDNQYRIYQAMQEWAWQGGGLSWQQELHWKSIKDRVNGGTRDMFGGYAQVGWFPAERWNVLPSALEVAGRIAHVNSDSFEEHDNTEATAAVNWFFVGHRNKLTLDVSYLTAEEQGERESDMRYRLQWEVSI